MSAARHLRWALPVLLAGCQGASFAPRPLGTDYAAMDADRLLASGRAAFRDGRVAEAGGIFRRAVQRRPGDVGALNGLAAVYDRVGRYDLAAPLYRRALALEPDSAMTRRNLALSMRLAGGTVAPDPGGTVAAGVVAAAAEPAPTIDAAPASGAAAGLRREADGQVTLVTTHAAGARRWDRPGVHDGDWRTTTILVLNATGTSGAAARMQARLAQGGWRRTLIGTAPRVSRHSAILHRPAETALAEAIARRIGAHVRLRATDGIASMIVVLGTSA